MAMSTATHGGGGGGGGAVSMTTTAPSAAVSVVGQLTVVKVLALLFTGLMIELLIVHGGCGII